VKPEQIPRLAQLAEVDFTNQTNPRPAKAADYERLLTQAM
jgi:alcohol dehydrogenase class IV